MVTSKRLRLPDPYKDVTEGDIVGMEHDWVRTFALLPHITIRKRFVWFRYVYVRRVWIYTGFIDEPVTQYGDIFDVLRT